MEDLKLYTGDDWAIGVSLTRYGQPEDLSTATEVKFALTKKTTVVASGTALSGTAGANWAGGLVVCLLDDSATVDLSTGSCTVQIRAIVNGKKQTWETVPMFIAKGVIT